MNVESKAVGYAIYDAPAKLKAFLIARASGAASKQLLMQLAEDAEAERLEELKKKPAADILDFSEVLRKRNESK